MDSNTDRLSYLLARYADELCTEQEVKELHDLLIDDWKRIELGRLAPQIDWDKMYREIVGTPVIGIRKTTIWKRIAVAAAVILLVALGIVISKQLTTEKSHPALAQSHDVDAPQITKAQITLSNGKIVSLDSLSSFTEANAEVKKTADGKITYHTVTLSGVEALTVSYNTLTNPRGSKVVNLTLSDGTKVWLNAESSLKYPVAFTGNERKVSVTGEAYFSVKHNEKMPFKVIANGVEIQDLGTEFNVNAYSDEEAVKTTLIQGSIKVSARSSNDQRDLREIFLKPGEQAITSNFKSQISNNININAVMAWKDNKFYFDGVDIKTIMRQLSRWYDVDVVYEGNEVTEHFTGIISREVNMLEVFHMLQQTGVLQVKIEGKKVIISK